MKICITGGAGFIGSSIADKYIELGHEVVVIDNLSLGFKSNIPKEAKFYEMDINDKNIIDVFQEEKFDVVTHFAAQMSVRHSVASPSNDALTNIMGGINIFDSASKSGVKKIIFASSAGTVYGEQNEFPCTETHQNLPVSPYGVSKFAEEKYLQYYHTVFGLNYTIFRYTNVYGPRQNPFGEAGVIAIFALKMLKNEDTYLTGFGKITRDYVFIEDVVAANVLALSPEITGIFNIATAIETDLDYIYDSLAKLTHYNKEKVYIAEKIGEQKRSVCSSAKFQKLTGWQPKTFLPEGLPKTVEFYKSLVQK